MGRKEKVPTNVKLIAVQECMNGSKGTTQICKELQIDIKTLRTWLRKYETKGAEGLLPIKKNTCYTESHKLQVIAAYMSGKGSYEQMCKEYNIPSTSILRRWIKKYNSDHGVTKSHNVQGDRNMIKGRKTTYEERIDIDCFLYFKQCQFPADF